MNTANKIFPIFSYVFHPLFIPIYAVLAYFYLSSPFYDYTTFYIIFIQVVIITILVPLTIYYLLLSLGAVDSVMLEKKSQRKIPLIFHAILLYILINKTITYSQFNTLHCFFLASIISTIAALIFVFFKFKASLHMVAIVALTTFVMILSYYFQMRLLTVIATLFIICGLVATSRLSMKAHNNIELFVGSLIGFLPQLTVFYISENYRNVIEMLLSSSFL